MASIVDFSALLSAFPDRDLAKVSVQEFVTRLSDPGQKGHWKIGDEQRLLQLDILLCAGLCLDEETIQGNEITVGNPREAVEDLLTSIFERPTAVLEVLKSRSKLNEVKEACCRLPALFLLEHAALRQRPHLETKLKTAEACRMSTCNCKSQMHLECMKTWKDIDEILRRIGDDLSLAEKDEKIQLVQFMEVEVVGFHYYMIFLHLQHALRIHMTLYENQKNSFEDVLDTCEAAYSKLEKELRTSKAPKRKGSPLREPTDRKILRTNFKTRAFKPIYYSAGEKMHNFPREEFFTDEIPGDSVPSQKMPFQSEGRIDDDKMIQIQNYGTMDAEEESARLALEKGDLILDDQERRQTDLKRTIEEFHCMCKKQFRIIRTNIEDKQRLEEEVERQKSAKKTEQRLNAELAKQLTREGSSDRTEPSAKVISLEKRLKEKDEIIEKQNADIKMLLSKVDKFKKKRDELACQRERERKDAVRQIKEVQERQEAEIASFADQLERENSEKKELSALLIALQKTLREKEESIELQSKQNDAEFERLNGQLKKIRTNRDDLESQLREEKQGRLRDNEGAVRERRSVEQRLEALADQLERETSDKKDLSSELIALRETLKEKEETIELQKQNDADSERLRGELRKLEMDRDDLTFQLRNLQAEIASFPDQLERENNDKKELSAELIALQKTVIANELQQKQNEEDSQNLRGELRKVRADRDDLESQLRQEREGRQKERQDAVRERSNAVQSFEKQMEERHRIETNRLKADVVAEAAALKRQRDKLYEDAQKRLAENSQVEQLSDPNRPSEVAKRYGDLFQHTYDVAEVLETEKDVEEDECNSFVVEMLMISSKAAEATLSEYETSNAKANGLNESFLKKNPTAKRILKESVTSLLRLASAAKREENSKRITDIALKEIQASYPKYYCQETAPTIEKFLSSSSSVVWEVIIFSRPADFVLNDTTFDEAVHERFCGSDPKSDKIRSIVWPRLAEQVTGKTLCKGKVMTGE